MSNGVRIGLNTASAEVMHVDLNSSFASAEAQRYEFWRGKPLGVTPVNVPGGAIVSPSYELKAYGVKVGTRNFEAVRDVPGVILVQSTPSLYREIHVRFVSLFMEYSPDVKALSIDEVVLNLANTPIRKRKSMEEIGLEIKQRVRDEIGDSLRVNVGIGTCRFTAKLAAGLHKPDGMDRLDHTNLRGTYARLKLMDLPGINVGYRARLFMAGIETPLQFLDADAAYLRERAFKSIHGYSWHNRLRGYEVDDVEFVRKGFGNSVVLPTPTPYRTELLQTVYKLTHKASTRMRAQSYGCRTLSLYIKLKEARPLYGHITLDQPIIATREVFTLMQDIFDTFRTESVRRNSKFGLVWEQVLSCNAVHVAVRLENLVKDAHLHQQLIPDDRAKARRLSIAEDAINKRFGMYTIGSALLKGKEDTVVDRIPFGSPQDVQALYEDEQALRNVY